MRKIISSIKLVFLICRKYAKPILLVLAGIAALILEIRKIMKLRDIEKEMQEMKESNRGDTFKLIDTKVNTEWLISKMEEVKESIATNAGSLYDLSNDVAEIYDDMAKAKRRRKAC